MARDTTKEKTETPTGWDSMIRNLEARLEKARSMGGSEKLAKQASSGFLNARERISALLDPDSFRELGSLAGALSEGAPADAFPAGFGTIDGRPVLVGSEDSTVKGGSIGLAGADKRYRMTQLARQERVPLVFILHGAGHRITNALKGHGRSPNDLQGLVELAGIIPTVCVVLGASAGHGALAAPLMDFVVMSEGGALFSAGPPLVEAAIGEKVDKKELGGPDVHVGGSGVAHNRLPDDASALAYARLYLSYLPSNAWEYPPVRKGADSGERRLDEILLLVPANDRRPYDMHRLLSLLLDQDSLFEIQPDFGASLITALGRLGGRSVALVANNPNHKAGAFDRAAAEKGARFLEIMGGLHLPCIFLADNPGVMAGTAAEKEGVLRAAARMFAAQRRLQVPKLHVTIRKAFGFGSSAMAMNPFDDQTLALAFPGATLGAMPAGGAGAAAHSDAGQQAQLDAAEQGGPYRIADTMGFDEVIDPRELRNYLLQGLDLASRRESEQPSPVAHFGALP